MTKPPAVPPPGRNLADGIARLRAATGTPERRVLHRVCSIHRKAYTVTCERIDPREKFKIAAIDKSPENAGRAMTPVRRGPVSESFAADDFDNAGLSCPWCGNRSGTVYHTKCDTTYCGGTKSVGPGGSAEFRCRTCNETMTTEKAETLIGQSGARPRDALSSPLTKTLEGKKGSMLPRWLK